MRFALLYKNGHGFFIFFRGCSLVLCFSDKVALLNDSVITKKETLQEGGAGSFPSLFTRLRARHRLFLLWKQSSSVLLHTKCVTIRDTLHNICYILFFRVPNLVW